MLKWEFENNPKINNFIDSSLNGREEEKNDLENKSSKLSSHENKIRNYSFKTPNVNNFINNNNNNKLENRTASNKFLDINNKGVIENLNLNGNDDLKRLQIFSSQQNKESLKESFLDFGLSGKIKDSDPDTSNKFLNIKGNSKFIEIYLIYHKNSF